MLGGGGACVSGLVVAPRGVDSGAERGGCVGGWGLADLSGWWYLISASCVTGLSGGGGGSGRWLLWLHIARVGWHVGGEGEGDARGGGGGQLCETLEDSIRNLIEACGLDTGGWVCLGFRTPSFGGGGPVHGKLVWPTICGWELYICLVLQRGLGVCVWGGGSQEL